MAKKDAVVVVPPETKVAEIGKDLKKFEKNLANFTEIHSEEEYEAANAFLIEVKGRINRVKAVKEEYYAPMKKALDNLATLFSTPQKAYEAVEASVKRGMSNYRLAEDARIREEEARLRREAEEKRKEEEAAAKEAAAKGQPAPAPVPVAAPVSLARPEATVRSDAGKSTAKKVVKFEVVDADAIPKKYKDLVYAEAVKKGIVEQVLRPVIKVEGMTCKIPGIRVYEDFDISATA